MKPGLDVRYLKLRFVLLFGEDVSLPKYKVSALRGGMGQMLLDQHCLGDRDCEACRYAEECAVPLIYYHKLKTKPPFVTRESLGYLFECSDYRTEYQAGGTLEFSMILFGNMAIHFQEVLYALHALGMVGLSRSKAKYQIVDIANHRSQPVLRNGNIYTQNLRPDTVASYVSKRRERLPEVERVRFLTPFSVKYQGEFLREFQAEAWVRSIRRRIYLLNCLEFPDVEQPRWEGRYPEIVVQRCWTETVPRYSTTHQERISLWGLRGGFEVREIPEALLDEIIAGELLHIGKDTSMGFGKYRLLGKEEK